MKTKSSSTTNTIRLRTNLKAGERSKRRYPQDDGLDIDAP